MAPVSGACVVGLISCHLLLSFVQIICEIYIIVCSWLESQLIIARLLQVVSAMLVSHSAERASQIVQACGFLSCF